jgi:hypothetical protein
MQTTHYYSYAEDVYAISAHGDSDEDKDKPKSCP